MLSFTNCFIYLLPFGQSVFLWVSRSPIPQFWLWWICHWSKRSYYLMVHPSPFDVQQILSSQTKSFYFLRFCFHKAASHPVSIRTVTSTREQVHFFFFKSFITHSLRLAGGPNVKVWNYSVVVATVVVAFSWEVERFKTTATNKAFHYFLMIIIFKKLFQISIEAINTTVLLSFACILRRVPGNLTKPVIQEIAIRHLMGTYCVIIIIIIMIMIIIIIIIVILTLTYHRYSAVSSLTFTHII